MHIKVRRLDADLDLPAAQHPDDAGYDLYAATNAHIDQAGGRALVATGIAIAVPSGYAAFVLPRSGLALNHGVTCLNAPGLIDSGYRDELKVILVNHDPSQDYEIRRGDRIAQLVVQAVEHVRWREVSELSESDRGAGGFGHTGR